MAIKVVDQSVPTFTQQSFEASLSENTETFSAVVSTPAQSPASGGKIIYTIETGNEEELFSIDYNGQRCASLDRNTQVISIGLKMVF